MQEQNIERNGAYYPMRVDWKTFLGSKLIVMKWQRTMSKNDGITQEGGTAILSCDKIVQWMLDSVTDSTGLLILCCINLEVNSDYVFRIVFVF